MPVPEVGSTDSDRAFTASSERVSASPTLAGGNLYAIREDGKTFVAKSGDTFESVATNSLGDDVTVIASPVFVDGQILIRTFDGLYCIVK